MFTLLPVQNDFLLMYVEPHLATLVSQTYKSKSAKPNRFFMFHYAPHPIDSLPSVVIRWRTRRRKKAAEAATYSTLYA